MSILLQAAVLAVILIGISIAIAAIIYLLICIDRWWSYTLFAISLFVGLVAIIYMDLIS